MKKIAYYFDVDTNPISYREIGINFVKNKQLDICDILLVISLWKWEISIGITIYPKYSS